MTRATMLAMVLFGVCLAGCRGKTEIMERQMDTVWTEVIGPTMAKAATDLGTTTAQVQGQLSGINPGYVMELEGLWVTGFKGMAAIHLDGVSGNIAGATQAQQRAAARAKLEEPIEIP